MINKLNQVLVDTSNNFKQALFELDADLNAERFMIIDRITAKTIYHHLVPPSGIVKLVLNQKYAQKHDILVVILDDNGQYNAVCMDGVKLQEIDPFTVII